MLARGLSSVAAAADAPPPPAATAATSSATGAAVTASGAQAPTNASKTIGVAFVGGVEKWIVEYIPGYLADEYGAPVKARELKDVATTDDPAKAAKGLAAQRCAEDVCLVVVAGGGKTNGQQMAVDMKAGVGVVRIRTLRPPGDLTPEKKDVFQWRIEKETMRSVALLAGMPDCPFPRCALRAHASEAEMDFKARNLCPPCLVKTQGKLQALGVEVEENRPPARR
jgi:hypothetical protein